MARRKRKPSSANGANRWMVLGVLLFGAFLIWDAVLQPKAQRVPAQRPAQTPTVSIQPKFEEPSQAVQTPAEEPTQPVQTPTEEPRLEQNSSTLPIPMPEPSVQMLEPEAKETAAQTQSTRPALAYRPQPEVRRPTPKVSTYNPTPNTEVVIPGQAAPGLIFRHLATQTEDKTIALSFDDGPNPGYTQQILEVLRQYGVKATFFWLGREVNKYPELAQSVVAEGHAVGNHTWDHRTASSDEATAQTEIEGTAKEIEQATGVQTQLFRPPGGRLNNGLSDWALRSGYTVVMWSAQSNDWEEGVSAQDIVQNVLQAAQPGGVVLMHDGGGDRSRTVAALPQVIEGLQAQGYRFVTVPELLELEARSRPQ